MFVLLFAERTSDHFECDNSDINQLNIGLVNVTPTHATSDHFSWTGTTRETPPTKNILVVLKVVRRERADHGHGDALLHDLLLQRLDAVLVLLALLLESLVGLLLKMETRSRYG